MKKIRKSGICITVFLVFLAINSSGCGGSQGEQGPPGQLAVAITAETAGANCATGGYKVDFQDAAGTVLDSMYVCNGASGESPVVTAEDPGSNCAEGGVMVEALGVANYICSGANGTAGANGQSVTVTVDSAGSNCANGGLKIQSASGASYVCNGAPGTNGTNGQSVAVTVEVAGSNCANGGFKLISASGTTYVCNGAPGTNGTNGQSVAVTVEGSGPNCANGGFKLVSASGTTYVCHGAKGDKGDKGDPGVSIIWLGEFELTPVPCNTSHLNNAWHDTSDGVSYICNGSTWEVMAQDGSDRLPYVVYTDPAAGEDDVRRSISIQVIFNKEMNPSTIDGTTFEVTYGEGMYPVTGVVSYAKRTATFTPNHVLSWLRSYTVTVRAAVEDLDGVPMGYDHIFSFTTIARKVWGTAELIETSDLTALPPQVAVDLDGNAISVWAQYDGAQWNIWSNRYHYYPDSLTGSWGLAKLIETDNTTSAQYPQVVVDPEGNAVAVWDQPSGGVHSIWSNRYDAGLGTWGTAKLIETNNANEAQSPQVAVDPEGNAIAVWRQASGIWNSIWFNRYDAGLGTWGTAGLVETDDTGGASDPQIAVGPDGNAVAVWYQHDGTRNNIWSNRYDAVSGLWGTAVLIETDNAGGALYPQAAVDPEGNAVAVWHQYDGTRNNIWSNRYEAGLGTWGTAELIETDNAGAAQSSQVAVDPEGNAIAVWQQSDGARINIWSNRYEAGLGTWGTAKLIETDSAGDAQAPQVAVDPEGNAVAVWYQHDGAQNNIWSNRYEAGLGSWGTAELIETDSAGDAQAPQVAVDPEGNAVTVWYQYDSTRNNIWANRFD